MFKCKQCGRRFGANTPRSCPDCGAANKQNEPTTRGLAILSLLDTLGCVAVLVLIFLIVSGVTALVTRFF